MWEREYDSKLLEYLDDKHQCILLVNNINQYSILKNKCTVESLFDDKECQINVYNLQLLNSDEIHKIEIYLNNEYTARHMHEILEKVLITDTDEKYIISIETEMSLIEPIHLEVSKSQNLIYKCNIKDMKIIKEK